MKLSKARKVCYLLIRPDGTIPLVGDSEIRPGTFFPLKICDSPKGGVGYYPDAGLFVASMHNLHLTFRAGGTKFTHRHVDDLSFTLWAHGKDFIVDSGMYNYDTSDKLRRWFMSSRAHSGIYLESAGHILFRNFESPKRMSEFRAVNYDHKFFEVNGVHRLSKTVVSRKLKYEQHLITINDNFLSPDVERWRVQFILHPDVKIISNYSDKNSIILQNGGVRLIIRESSGKHAIRIESINYSPIFMQKIDNKCICFYGESKAANLKFTISLEDIYGEN